ncbi:MAG: TIGR00645 family protein [Pseudomonadota bacterium]|nr:TIGR00645 family protein [Pseudomonadota bacterium]
MNSAPKGIERFIERLVFVSRWLLVPIYFGLLILLLAFAAKALMEVAQVCASIGDISKKELILAVLSLIDLALVANLLVMVVLSSYETFVSRIDLEEGVERPAWLGKVDTSVVKIKLLMSIVAVSSIHLLEVYINIQNYTVEDVLGLVVIQVVFVLSALVLAYVDKLAFAAHRPP